jgi:hypothetical protein
MVARTFSVVGFIAAGCTAAAADGLSGRYAVNGMLANGMKYSVSAEIVMTSQTTCDIKWSDGSKGVCMVNGTTLSIASVVHGDPQIGVYQVAPDGSIDGVFTDNFHPKGVDGIHREKLTPVH